jgi:hypothetical protein
MVAEGKRKGKEVIVDEIINALSGPNCIGFPHVELAKILGIHRDTLRVHMMPLIRSGTVFRDQPKLGNYHLTQRIYLRPNLAGEIIANRFLAELFKKRFLYKRTLFPKNLKTEFGESLLAHALFSFSMAIGVFATFILISAMDRNNIGITSTDPNIKSNKLAEEWIRSALSSLTPKILWRFKFMIADFGYVPNKFTHLLNDESFNTLLADFSNLSPYLSIEFNNILREMPYRLDQSIQRHKLFSSERQRRHACKHEYNMSKRKSEQNILGDLESRVKCIKCGHIRSRRIR